MKTDIYQKISQDFGNDCTDVVNIFNALDAETKGIMSDRLVRAIIYLSNGSLDSLVRQIKLARLDWRDVFMNAEYSYPDRERLRDFSKSFHELGLLKN